jgi:hypothetical protein
LGSGDVPLIPDATNASPDERPSSPIGTPGTSIIAHIVHDGPGSRTGWNQDMNQYESIGGAVKAKDRQGTGGSITGQANPTNWTNTSTQGIAVVRFVAGIYLFGTSSEAGVEPP